MTDTLIPGTIEAWENGDLGRSAEHTIPASKELAAEIDASMGLKSISIRLQEDLIDSLKSIAKVNGIGYQPLIRTVLTRFAESELRQIARHQAELMAAQRAAEISGGPAEAVPPYETALLKQAA